MHALSVTLLTLLLTSCRQMRADESGPPALRRLTPGVVGTLQYSAPELLNEDLRPQGRF